MMLSKIFRKKMWLLFIAIFSLYACGGSGSSSGGGSEPQTPVEAPIGPDLNGDTWRGDFRTLDGVVTPLTATIVHEGNRVIIDTSLPDTGPEGRFQGTISAVGGLLVYDTFDGEDWTTLFGPASANSINLADFVFVDGQNTQTNIIILKR